MKSVQKFITVIAILGIAVSCVEEQRHEPEQFGNTPKIIAELSDDPQTRTCIDSDALVAGENTAVLWTPGDQLGVFTTGSSNVLYTNDETAENIPNASFSSTATVSGEVQYAYYPYDAANDGKAATALSGAVSAEQTMGQTLPTDYKYGELKAITEDGGYKFKFHNMFSLVRFKIDATGSSIEGQTLESVTMKVTRDGAAVPVTGDFTFSAVDGTYTLGTTSNELKTVWNKTLDAAFSSFATVFPNVKSGDKLTFEFRTTEYTTSFTVTSKVDFASEMYYTFPLNLATFAANPEKYGYAVTARPTISSFSFEVSKNSGKLLDNQLVWTDSDEPQFNSVSSHAANISGSEISLMIPYLYDFKLVPTFSVASGAVVTVDGKTITSGSTEVDFTGGTTFTVTTADDYRDYKVTLSNTGLPVVVLKQSSSGDFSKVYKDFWSQLLGGLPYNQFVDFMIRAKDTEWVEDDQITVYNADGTVSLPTALCGARLRGNTTQEYPKKPFAIKLVEKAPILDMPSHKRWILLANWLDHSMIRNTVAFDVAHAIESAWKTGQIEQGIPWNVHGHNVELVLVESDGTGHHVGNYYLCEQIKIAGSRLDIKDPYEDIVADGNASPTMADCGYLIEMDKKYDEAYKFKTSNAVPVMFKDDVSDGILSDVQTKIQGIEDNLDNGAYAAAYEDLDINSVIDQWLIWELTMNREYADPGSVYMYMDGDGKLCAGPVWDFDRGTFQNTTNAAAQGNDDRVKPYNEWMCWRSEEQETYSYIWYRQLLKDSTFQTAVQARWNVIYPYLQGVVNDIRNYGTEMKTSFEVNSAMWPTDADAIHAYKDPFTDWSGDEEIEAWEDVIENFVTVYNARLEGMNSLITSGKFTE